MSVSIVAIHSIHPFVSSLRNVDSDLNFLHYHSNEKWTSVRVANPFAADPVKALHFTILV